MIAGMDIRVLDWIPEFSDERTAYDDWEERLYALTLHHCDLSLLDLTFPQRAVFILDGKTIYCHPNTFHFIEHYARPEHHP